ncbi:hypothetical protein [Vibrio splendidus]|uniref:hypothetical protein n=1 Tax=Vibrio splendidus TaxID=29497 RepID=UPI001FB33FE3|nr:hypothetical protein [Vibrio splendidus]UOE84240.1 hypothetical protein LTQ54_15060 [Vibrio splendidus]
MQKVIDSAVSELIKIIDSKKNNKKVAWQFVLEELDAAKNGDLVVQDRMKRFYINEADYNGAMLRSWDDVDGPTGPQQFLVMLTMALSSEIGSQAAALVRISIVEFIIHHYKVGCFFINEEILTATKPLKLFETIAEESKLNPNYLHLLTDEYKPVRDVITRWASGFEDRDNKFNYEFQTTFNSSFWEVYLYQCFKDLNLSVDFSKASPDFTILSENKTKTVNIEAVTANHAHDSEPEWTNDCNIRDHNKFLDFACVRILNAIKSKHDKYFKTYSKYDHVKGHPYVVAIAPFEQKHFFMQNNEAIIRVLYGQGVDARNGPEEVKVPVVMKNDVVPLELGMFTSDKFKEISAVIFSTTATIGKAIVQSELERDIRISRYHEFNGLLMDIKPNKQHFETHLDGLQIHHNPYAENKLDPDLFSNYEITHYYYDIEKEKIDNQQKSYTIISRNIYPPSEKSS